MLKPFSYSQYWTGTSVQVRLVQEVFSNANDIYLFLVLFPLISQIPRIQKWSIVVPAQLIELTYTKLAI